ncbi:uncharacterized protein LOC112088229 isoform X2 [Eutrema salsugineum]|uniref:uncharacterized protein LOC112088229 isoform X2 n=1 Tax=Eutrema salsugineum TaxID=72664 RepID=UPI000CED7465|nr:uncharacterized protein LOC112088229 isoform X2 [Eutrema salsugineum]
MATRNLATTGLRKRCETFIIDAENFALVHARGKILRTFLGIPLLGFFWGALELASRIAAEREMLKEKERDHQRRLQLLKERESQVNAKLARMVGLPYASDQTTQG